MKQKEHFIHEMCETEETYNMIYVVGDWKVTSEKWYIQRSVLTFGQHVSLITSPGAASHFAYTFEHLLFNKTESYNVYGTKEGQPMKWESEEKATMEDQKIDR